MRVLVEPSALQTYRQLAVESPMPEGARVLALYESSEGTLLAGYVLEKRGGAWYPTLLDAKGQVVETDAAACLRCHQQAPTDGLFGVAQRAAATAAPH